ncbi:hypothetical protein [Fluviicola sp.]|uniref:hypothetical protein n=1 Tax=Fluviicola sp. TaxID=1917219 RepID=UPI0026380AD5|nr:hypothetical protein [Fluviicola sp.]
MNITNLLSKAELFQELIITSGFRRDLGDYIQSIQQSHNQNLVFMKDLSERIKKKYYYFEDHGLFSDLKLLLKDSAFTENGTFEKLVELDLNTEIDANSYYDSFYNILNQLVIAIDNNVNEIESITKILNMYVEDEPIVNDKEKSLIALVFKDLKTVGTIKEFSKSLNKWNRTLIIFHTLVKSDSPSEITLDSIHNGSIEVICNVDVDVSADLAQMFKYGMEAFAAYLAY